MGNTNDTILEIDEYFENDIVTDAKPINILIKLPIPSINDKGEKINKIYVTVTVDGYSIYLEKDPLIEVTHEWSPKSHMREYEICDPNTRYEVLLRRCQGIGVLILEPLETYIKLYYDKSTSTGIKCICTCWYHKEDARILLGKDLGIGYNVLLINNEGIYDLCEKCDDRDQLSRITYSNGFYKIHQYDHL